MPTEPNATRKPTTQPLTPPPELLAPSATPRGRLPAWWRWAVVAGAALPLAAGWALLLLRANDPRADTRPIDVVKGFVAAIEAKVMPTRCCVCRADDLSPRDRPRSARVCRVPRAGALRRSRYELLDNDGDRAHVRWTATMHYTLDLGDERQTKRPPASIPPLSWPSSRATGTCIARRYRSRCRETHTTRHSACTSALAPALGRRPAPTHRTTRALASSGPSRWWARSAPGPPRSAAPR